MFSLLVEDLCHRLNLLNPVPVSWAGGSGSQKGGGGLGGMLENSAHRWGKVCG